MQRDVRDWEIVMQPPVNHVIPISRRRYAALMLSLKAEHGRPDDEATRAAAAGARGSMAQRGPETESGGRPSTAPARGDTSGLEPFTVIDDDTGADVTVYREARGRGTEERDATT